MSDSYYAIINRGLNLIKVGIFSPGWELIPSQRQRTKISDNAKSHPIYKARRERRLLIILVFVVYTMSEII